MDDDGSSTPDSATVPSIPRNPSDAWQLLKDVAERDADRTGERETEQALAPDRVNITDSRIEHRHKHHDIYHDPNSNAREAQGSINGAHAGIASYRLVREGYLTADIVHALVSQYADHYHPYLPLVPRKYFDPANIDGFAVNEKHLLTAVLTIASKDYIDQPNVHLCCSRYMHDLISGIAAGHDCDVEAVEALLLLAEWEPQGLRNRIEAVGQGEENRSSWMHVGLALRTGYFLGLDRTAFRQESAEEARIDGRKRLAWANCYVSDRLISVRIGRAFWSRGPGPMTGLSSQDFPSLQPLNPGDEDYAKVFQATLDLTQLYSNVHDVLYSGMRTSGQMMLMGDYVKYVDEFRSAIARWNNTWSPFMLTCCHHIKITLQMSFEYLRLYTNAFVFQAQISQAISRVPKGEQPVREHLRSMFSNIGSLPDARFIWDSLQAAKSFLTLLNTQIDPVKHLRYMPLRFYLYSIYSAVFLYKARSYGVMDAAEERQVRNMIHQSMDVLKRSSVSSQDPGSRYARLLERLWVKQPKTIGQSNASTQSPAATSDSQLSASGSITLNAGGYMQYSPANDFSWLDLEAVGDFVTQEQIVNSHTNMLAPTTNYQAPSGYMNPLSQGMQWQQPTNAMNLHFDMQGNLLF